MQRFFKSYENKYIPENTEAKQKRPNYNAMMRNQGLMVLPDENAEKNIDGSYTILRRDGVLCKYNPGARQQPQQVPRRLTEEEEFCRDMDRILKQPTKEKNSFQER